MGQVRTSGGSRRAIPGLTRRELARLERRAGEAAALLKALSNEKRLLILCTLAAGELSVSELNARIPLSQSALSQQLAVLRREGLVRTRRDAQTIYYSVAPSNAVEIIEVLRRLYCGGRTRPVRRAG
ncbi:MAG TPA: metalloregulator ArsR/SmtB family transcription factor [Woeseiaceae bacterium]|nr:metalloregulator ArsR/SmtB family transcription factor [Woeseiaceae bacterium]